VPATQGFAQPHTPLANVHLPGCKKFGLGAMLADGLEIVGAGALGTGTVVVVPDLGCVVVVVGAGEACEMGFVVGFVVLVTTRATWRFRATVVFVMGCVVGVTLATCFTMVVVVAGTVVVVVVEAIVGAVPRPAEGSTTVAMAGRAVVARTTPATREPMAPMSTERRGPRRCEERPAASPEILCPCVIFVMYQLSETKSKVPPTSSQHPLNSLGGQRSSSERPGSMRFSHDSGSEGDPAWGHREVVRSRRISRCVTSYMRRS
jgi:hypothetical protein